jgi:uncharacterized protein YaaR (DUF327 family)
MTNLLSKIEEFLETLNREPKTIRTYRNALKQFVSIVGDNAKLTVETYVEFLKELKKLSPSTQRVYTTAVKKFINTAAGHAEELDDETDHYTRTP